MHEKSNFLPALARRSRASSMLMVSFSYMHSMAARINNGLPNYYSKPNGAPKCPIWCITFPRQTWRTPPALPLSAPYRKPAGCYPPRLASPCRSPRCASGYAVTLPECPQGCPCHEARQMDAWRVGSLGWGGLVVLLRGRVGVSWRASHLLPRRGLPYSSRSSSLAASSTARCSAESWRPARLM